MGTLLFKKKFHDAIRDGSKTQTVRLWEKCWPPARAFAGQDAPTLQKINFNRYPGLS